MASVFISHAHGDEHLARALATLLANALSLTPGDFFLSSQEGRGVAPAAGIRAEILRELSSVPALVVLLTPKAAASPWVWLEAGNRLGHPDRPNPLFVVPSARHVPLLQPVSDLRCLRLDNDGELHELVQAAGSRLGKTPVNVLIYRDAIADLVSAAGRDYSIARERRDRAVAWLKSHAAALAIAALGFGTLAYGATLASRSAGDPRGTDASVDLNSLVVSIVAEYMIFKGTVASSTGPVHAAAVMVSREGEVRRPEDCALPTCTFATTRTDGGFTIDLTRIQAQKGNNVVLSVSKPDFKFMSREVTVDVRAMDVGAAPMNVLLASDPGAATRGGTGR
jgi:hypothetical protein